MIQTPILDSALPTNKDLNDNGPYHAGSTPKGHGASANLRDRLENQRNSPTLNLADMFLGDEGANELAEALHHPRDFSSIQLRGNNISAVGFAAICQHLQNCPNLKEIAAEWNNVGSDPSGLAALHQYVRTSKSLQVIDLKNNRIGPNCGRAIGDLIRDSSTLTKIDLRWNELGEEGGQQILNALQDSKKKISFELNGNRIPEQILVQINQNSSTDRKTETATKISIFDQPAKRMAQITGERLYQSQLGQPVATQKEDKPRNIVDDYTTNKHETYALGNTLPSKYSNLNAGTHPTTHAVPNENNLKQFSTTYKKSHEKTDLISDKYLYNSAVHGGHGANTLRVDTLSDARTITLGQDRFSSAGTGQRIDTFGGSSSQKYSHHGHHDTKVHGYSSPLRGLEEKHEEHLDDMNAQIETTKRNIDRYSPNHKGRSANIHEFRYETSRPSYEIKTEVVRKSGTKGVDSPPVREEKGSSIQKYKSGSQTSDFRAESGRNVHVTHTHTTHVVDDGSLKVGKLISDLERTVEIEREKAREAQIKLDAALRDLEIESRGRQEFEKKHSYILEELRKRDIEVNELRIKVDTLSRDNNGLSAEVHAVRAENEKIIEFNRVGMSEIEEKYIRQLKHADGQSQSLREQLISVQRDMSTQIVEMRTEYDGKMRNYDEQVREFSRLNDELSNELANQLEFIERLKVEQEENLRKAIVEVREEEVRRAQPIIRGLEDEVRTLKITNEDLTAKNSEMLHDLQAYERQMREQHMQFATELNRLGSEHDRIRGELNQANINIQRLNGEISMRNNTIKNLEGDIDRLRAEIQRQADMYVAQIENMKRDFDSERRRFAEQERQLIHRIEETERRLVESQNETVIITREYDRLVEVMQGNVSKAIHDTFVTHKHTSEIRHVEHRSTPSERPIMATSRIISTSEKKYL